MVKAKTNLPPSEFENGKEDVVGFDEVDLGFLDSSVSSPLLFFDGLFRSSSFSMLSFFLFVGFFAIVNLRLLFFMKQMGEQTHCPVRGIRPRTGD